MSFSPLLDNLIQALQCLPGVGPRSAQRMSFYLLEKDRARAQTLSTILAKAIEKIGRCQRCRTFCEDSICKICSNERRDQHCLCIIETPADVLVIEQTGLFKGLYFVLMGHLSPLDGIGPKELGLQTLKVRLQENKVKELFLAISPTIEGEATAYYLAQMAQEYGIKTTQIAQGVPMGGELEYLDPQTLARAIREKTEL